VSIDSAFAGGDAGSWRAMSPGAAVERTGSVRIFEVALDPCRNARERVVDRLRCDVRGFHVANGTT
jgi:hypothetical protein